MSMRTPVAPLVLAAMVGVATPHDALCKQTKNICSWLAVGGGRSSLGFAAGSAALSLEVNHLLISARSTANASEPIGGEEYEDYALVAGYGWRVEDVRVSVAAGLAYVRGSEWREERGPWVSLFGGERVLRGPVLGFPLEIQVFYRLGRFVGVGTYAFCNLNALKPFGGVTVTLILGKLR